MTHESDEDTKQRVGEHKGTPFSHSPVKTLNADNHLDRRIAGKQLCNYNPLPVWEAESSQLVEIFHLIFHSKILRSSVFPWSKDLRILSPLTSVANTSIRSQAPKSHHPVNDNGKKDEQEAGTPLHRSQKKRGCRKDIQMIGQTTARQRNGGRR
ncbi:hypothetical protein BDZ91DRAFT_740182 [Kalaharituber pfeilii]|nr:hypothetical protein BDZ91DRAFT_740182 [Kalaharituber pfeilii]